MNEKELQILMKEDQRAQLRSMIPDYQVTHNTVETTITENINTIGQKTRTTEVIKTTDCLESLLRL